MAVSVKDFLDAIRGRFNDEPNKVEVTGSNVEYEEINLESNDTANTVFEIEPPEGVKWNILHIGFLAEATDSGGDHFLSLQLGEVDTSLTGSKFKTLLRVRDSTSNQISFSGVSTQSRSDDDIPSNQNAQMTRSTNISVTKNCTLKLIYSTLGSSGDRKNENIKLYMIREVESIG